MGRRRRAAGAWWGGLVLVGALAHSGRGEGRWGWPLGTTPVLTSSFGEPRGTHPHAGIDLGTGGRTGVVCNAVGDGWVARMRMSPFGYGKALYIQLDSGPLVVYAHLERFAEPMAARAWREQVARGRYTFDLSLDPGEIRVQRGQVVAWSGETGIGSPHLHFEVREGDVARNPQTAGFAVRDLRTPVISDVEILPLDANAQVEGRCAPQVLPVGEAALPRVRAAGRIGFAVRALDRAAPGPYRQVPYRYEVRVDGSTLYRAVHERFDYAYMHHLVLDYDPERLQTGARAFLLYKRAGNRLAGRDPAAADGALAAGDAAGNATGALAAAAGRHEVEIEVADVAGHVRRVRFPLVVSRVPRIDDLVAVPSGDSLHIECTASDADGDSLTLTLAVSRDGGSVWESRRARRGPESGAWKADLAWSGKRVVVRARVEDPSGLWALRTVVAPAPEPTPGEFGIALSRRSRYGRMEVALEPAVILADAPRLYLQPPVGPRRPVAGLQQTGERRYEWVGAAADVEDTDALVVEATAMDGRRAILREPARVRLVQAGRARVVEDLHPYVRLEFDGDALFEDAALEIGAADARRLALGSELHPAGVCVRVEPRAAALDRPARIAVQVPEVLAAGGAGDGPGGDSTGIGLFGVDADGDLQFLAAQRGPGSALVGETRRLGVFALLRDATPPRLQGFQALPAARGIRLQCAILEDGAGLADDAIDADIDGVTAIPEWDPESGKVRLLPTTDPGPGLHRLTVRVRDRVGNRASQSWEFTVP